MSIRKQVVYNQSKKQFDGFEDIGEGGDGERVATQVLVFMLVGIKKYWKLPLSYFFIKSLTASEQKLLVLQAIAQLENINVKVRQY